MCELHCMFVRACVAAREKQVKVEAPCTCGYYSHLAVQRRDASLGRRVLHGGTARATHLALSKTGRPQCLQTAEPQLELRAFFQGFSNPSRLQPLLECVAGSWQAHQQPAISPPLSWPPQPCAVAVPLCVDQGLLLHSPGFFN